MNAYIGESVRCNKESGGVITAAALNSAHFHEDYTKNPVDVVAGVNILCGKTRKTIFGGKFDKVKLGMYITKVIYSNPATIVFWSDDTKTMSKVQKGDTYSKETGLALCILKKLVGGEQVAQLLTDWVSEENYVDLKSIRSKNKKNSVIVASEEITQSEPITKKRGRPRKESNANN